MLRAPVLRHHIPVPKTMAKAAVSEAPAKVWVAKASEQARAESIEVESEDDDEGMYFSSLKFLSSS